MKKTLNLISVISVSVFAFLIILHPEICLKGVANGVMLCGNVIIPSLYPFTFCVLFIKSGGLIKILKPLNFMTKRLFHLSYYEFSLFLLSLIGGYPLGAKLLSQSNVPKAKQALMINFCINAGPAFVVLAIGKGVFKSVALGWLLFFSHILSSLIIALILGRFIKSNIEGQTIKTIGTVNNFVNSAADAADTVIKICGLVILFSAISGYTEMLSNYIKPLKYFGLLLEVTTAVFKTENLITVSFLLGFSGISIWCQVFSLLKNAKINYLSFIAFRLLHGLLSAGITLMLLRVFKISISTLSNGIAFNYKTFVNGPAVAFSLIIMGIILIISLYNKKYAGNLIEDMV